MSKAEEEKFYHVWRRAIGDRIRAEPLQTLIRKTEPRRFFAASREVMAAMLAIHEDSAPALLTTLLMSVLIECGIGDAEIPALCARLMREALEVPHQQGGPPDRRKGDVA